MRGDSDTPFRKRSGAPGLHQRKSGERFIRLMKLNQSARRRSPIIPTGRQLYITTAFEAPMLSDYDKSIAQIGAAHHIGGSTIHCIYFPLLFLKNVPKF